jgi:uncharacterized RDD family membrane protein YckC
MELDQQRRAAQAFITGAAGQPESVRIVFAGEACHVLLAQQGKLYHHWGFPTGDIDDAGTRRRLWNPIDARPAVWSLTDIDGLPAVLTQSAAGRNSKELWRWLDGKWQRAASHAGTGNVYNPEMTTFTVSDGTRTFAVVSSSGGLAHELLELHPDRIEKVKDLGGPMSLANPMVSAIVWMYVGLITSPLVVMFFALVGADWLMWTHREPCYHKGRLSVPFASLLRRLVASLVDFVICFGPVVLAWYLWFVQRNQGFVPFFEELDTNPRAVFAEMLPVLWTTTGWLTVFAVINWLTLAWGGFTIGKLLCGVRVVRTNLEPMGLLRALARNILSLVESSFFSGLVTLALIALTQNRQRLGDLVAGSVVVNAGGLRQAKAGSAGVIHEVSHP